jgi:hypothetical protein
MQKVSHAKDHSEWLLDRRSSDNWQVHGHEPVLGDQEIAVSNESPVGEVKKITCLRRWQNRLTKCVTYNHIQNHT